MDDFDTEIQCEEVYLPEPEADEYLRWIFEVDAERASC